MLSCCAWAPKHLSLSPPALARTFLESSISKLLYKFVITIVVPSKVLNYIYHPSLLLPLLSLYYHHHHLPPPHPPPHHHHHHHHYYYYYYYYYYCFGQMNLSDFEADLRNLPHGGKI